MIFLEKTKKEQFSIYLFKGGFTKEFPMQRQNEKNNTYCHTLHHVKAKILLFLSLTNKSDSLQNSN